MAVFPRGNVWWYKFYFAGQFIRESSKSTSKTVAKNAETQRRRELEQGFNNVPKRRENRVRQLRDVAEEYLADYRLRFRGVTFAEYAIGHVVRLLGDALLVDIDESAVFKYQTDRLKESAAPKSINEEVRFLLTLIGEAGDVIRVRLRKKKKLKLPARGKIGKAYEPEETQQMQQLSRNSRSPHIHLALTMALNAGMRDAEIKSLAWSQIHLDKNFIEVGKSKTAAGEGRTIPINSVLQQAIDEHMAWYRKKFNEIRPEWFVFPFGRPRPWDPTRHVTTIKTAWRNIRTNAKVTGRWHDHRHTLITQLAEDGAGEETIRQIVGHVSKEALRDYLHVRMKAKREALQGIVKSLYADTALNLMLSGHWQRAQGAS
jgi:integrase